MKLKNTIRIFFSLLVMGLFVQQTQAQEEKPSPARTAKGSINGANITVNYSSPAVKGRSIWGDLVPLGQVWRAGANEATTFETDKDIKVQGETLPAGKYSLFLIPDEYEPMMIFNKVHKQWGAFEYDQAEDALRVKVSPEGNEEMEERLVYNVTDDGLEVKWEYWKTKARIE
ncbi:DUF2911 domain-containing protein [Pararhodonellum marinum]|uniref:DUF2911 domain-containing protein n=1 Tax=Pararhodonellum marinum TaxID=2755358 RepID=UPI001E4EA81F|nr:DUF2911 domain-containing protein [Pararhodonellum marinum]